MAEVRPVVWFTEAKFVILTKRPTDSSGAASPCGREIAGNELCADAGLQEPPPASGARWPSVSPQAGQAASGTEGAPVPQAGTTGLPLLRLETR